MATIVNNPGPERVVTVDRADTTSGWAVAVVVLIAVIVGLFVWYHYHHAYMAPAQPNNTTGTINVTLPQGNGGNPSADGSSGTTVGGSAGAGTGY